MGIQDQRLHLQSLVTTLINTTTVSISNSPSCLYPPKLNKSPPITATTMSDGQVLKPDKDFSKEVDKQLPEAESLALV
jgi:hypothetical protein